MKSAFRISKLILGPLLLAFIVLASLESASAQSIVYQNLPQLDNRIEEACRYLRTLFNPALGLIRETNGSQTYHVASDNLLAQKALESCDTSMAASIRTSIAQCCGNGHNGMHEALLGEAITIPIPTAKIKTIANTSSYIIQWEVHNGTGTLSPFDYADVASYSGLEMMRRGNQTGTSEMVENLNIMFDGQGMVDEPYQNGPPGELGIYQIYKLALYIHLQARQNRVQPGLVERLLRMQGTGGGLHTGYDHAGTYAGTLANAETTSIAIIILNQLTAQQTPPFFFPFFFTPSALSQLVLYQLIATVAGVAITLGFVYWDRRRARRRIIEQSGYSRSLSS